MKKTYMRPQICIENFVMDMAIASDSSTECYKSLVKAYESLPNTDFNGNNVTGIDDEEDFQIYLSKVGYDNSTSGYCYFTNARPS